METQRACDCCGYPTETKTYHTGIPRQNFDLCVVCASTHLSKAVTYPDQCGDGDIRKAIGWIANKLLEEIRSKP